MDIQGVNLKEREKMFGGVMNGAAWLIVVTAILVGFLAVTQL